nr:MAG TPA: hypothetical protein [Caudoviricetes sp.]
MRRNGSLTGTARRARSLRLPATLAGECRRRRRKTARRHRAA